MTSRSRSIAAYALAAAVLFAAAAGPAFSQKYPGPEQKPAEQKATEPKAVDQEQQIMSPLDVKDADIQDVVRTISKGYNLNIVLDKDVAGKVTVHLSDVPVIEGLRTLSRSIGMEVAKEGNVYRIRKARDETRSVISYANGRLTVDVQNIDAKEFLKDISAKAAISIVPDAKVQGRISGKLYQVDLDDGLRALLAGSGLKLVKRKNIYQVLSDEDAGPGQGGGQPGTPYPGYRRYGNAPGGSGPASFFVECANGKVSLDVSNGNLADVIKAIAEQSEMEIITYGTVSGEINAKLKNVPLTQALALLLGGTMFTFVQKDSIILIGDRNAATPAGQALSKSELIHLNCIKADGVMSILPKDIPPNNVKVIKEQNALLVSGTSEDIVSVREFINTIDIPTPQVSIDAVIVEYKENLNKEFGVNAWWHRQNQSGNFSSTPTFKTQAGDASSSFDFGVTGLSMKDLFSSNGTSILAKIPDDFFFLLHYLESQDMAKVLAQPTLVTLNGNKASINVSETQYFKMTTGNVLGTDYSIRFQPINFGIKLDITPWISKGGQITAEIAPEVSNSDGVNPDGNYPNVSTRAITTTVRLKDGETIILGGLVKNQETETREKIPFFGDIPLIGVFFRKNVKARTKSNLVVYITPHIITKDASVDLKEELYKIDRSSKEFMDKKIDDLFNKKNSSIKPDSSGAGRQPAKQIPQKQDSLKTAK